MKALLGIEAIFGKELPHEAKFVQQVTKAYLSLLAKGAEGDGCGICQRLMR